MTRDDIDRMAFEAGFDGPLRVRHRTQLETLAAIVAAAEREALEKELLKLKDGIASNSEYIQGRWDLIGEFQDVIRARNEK